MKLKKISVLFAALVLSLGLVACQGVANGDTEKEPNTNVSTEKELQMETENETESEAEEVENAISQEKLDWFETVFFNDDENRIVNMFLASEYDAVADIDLADLFYHGDNGLNGSGEISDDEKAQAINHFGVGELDVAKAAKTDVDAVLQKYAGLTLDTTNKVGLEKLFYAEGKDAYYNVVGDTEYMKCDITKGCVNEDGTITLQYCDALSSISDTYEVTLKEAGDSYHFISNKCITE
jgi:hypothetical protein